MSKRRLLVIEDNQTLRDMIVALFTSDFDVYEASIFETGISLAKQQGIDCLITDIALARQPDEGLSIISRLRSDGFKFPIIAMSGTQAEDLPTACIRAGAQAFLKKPFPTNYLLALVDRHMESIRSGPNPAFVDGRKAHSEAFYFGTARIDAEFNITFPGAQPQPLGPKQVGILQFFSNHAGRLVKRPDLITAVWGEAANQHSNSLSTYLSSLRKLYETHGDDFSLWVKPEIRIGWRIAPAANSAPAS